jgi:uncharacterized protein (TIGR02996 family)
MSDRLGLMRAIHEQPEDDLPRLAYADWFEEQGDPNHAEFVRVEVALSRARRGSPEYRVLFDRELELIRAHKDAWFGTFRSGWGGYEIRRGFIEEVWGGKPESVLPHADWLHSHHTLQDLYVGGFWGALLPLLHHPLMDVLARLTLFNPESGSWCAAPYQRSAPLRQRPLALSLTRHHGGPELVEGLLASPRLGRVTWLDLSENELTADGVRRLLDGLGALPRLTTLRLDGTATSPSPQGPSGWPNIGPAGVRLLAGHPAVAQLERLDVAGNRIDAAAVRALVESPHLRSVRRLGVGGGLSVADRRLLRRCFGERVELPEKELPG